jgi:hypothetical protein
MSIIETLTEGMVHRNMQKEGAALLNKWSATGLLEGLSNDEQKSGMARLLENQARELLRESNTMAGGDVEGFAAVAFPIVRRVFAGLIANDLVSVQPMSLPSGLIFFMDFTFGTDPGNAPDGAYDRLGNLSGSSIYGQGVTASEITGGVKLDNNTMNNQPYGLGSAYAAATGSLDANSKDADGNPRSFTSQVNLLTAFPNGVAPFAGNSTVDGSLTLTAALAANGGSDQEMILKMINYDADLLAIAESTYVAFYTVTRQQFRDGQFNEDLLTQIAADVLTIGGSSAKTSLVRRLTQKYDAVSDTYLVVIAHSSDITANGGFSWTEASFPIKDGLTEGGSLGSVVGTPVWGLEAEDRIPEIDIKVDSIAITAQTKKLKAKWTPELGQDLNAYHNLDAEVELTSILSEQIALEIDREILQDLIQGATAGKFYWSRAPGRFVNRLTGAEVGASTNTPDFTGTVSEWYETLIETINDVSAQIHRKTLRGGANFVVLSPEVANILEFTAGFRANVTADADKGDIGAVKVGSLNRKFDVIVDPYFPRNAILVGRKGSSFLESGYVYAPYVPLQTTPTIFGPDDFVPRKGVMTRYGKKMVRPDMYGLVIIRDLLGADS